MLKNNIYQPLERPYFELRLALPESKKLRLHRVSLSTQDAALLATIYAEAEELFPKFVDSEKIVVAKIFSEKIKKSLPLLHTAFLNLSKDNKYFGLFLEGMPMMQHTTADIQKAEYMSLVFASMLGEPFQYLQQNDAKLVGHITPKEGFEMSQSGLSRGNFGWHTDDRLFSSEFRTKWIQLLGVYNPEKAETILAPIDTILKKLPSDVVRILMEKRFEVKMPTSFGFKNTIWSEPLSIIWHEKMGGYSVGIPTYNVRVASPEDESAKKALALFLSVIDSCKINVTLDGSSMLVFNNDRVLHGRTAFEGDRLVLRTYVRPDLKALRDRTQTQGNVFDARLLI